MDFDVDRFRVKEAERLSLDDRPTKVAQVYETKKHYHQILQQQITQISDLQHRLYAADTHSLLIIFQAMDAAGKDSVIRHVLSGINPQGCQVFSFKHPSAMELDHDFLWRTTQALPERGRIGVFNRSYYEEVLIVRVHPEILRAEKIPEHQLNGDGIWEQRYQSIRDHERHLRRNGTEIVKFFLHVSAEEQRKRFLARIDEPEKNWKFNVTDVKEREYWHAYMEAYEKCLSGTSTKYSPWYVIPADDKRNAHLLVARIVLESLASLEPKFPELTPERLDELHAIRAQLSETVGIAS
ncbi:MAG TPA: ADP-polyphosphate phosphotransferase [Dehalococcoidia bacterium]|nr:ADP-polyphosphate phosphotransferase [Dehalococcoidia bacterium]